MFGTGMLKGLGITMKETFNKKVTVQYPEQRHYIAARFHGEIVFDPDTCINCGLCAAACPNYAIKIDSIKVANKKIQTKFSLNMQYCLFCGLCVGACPSKSLCFSNSFELSKYDRNAIPLVLMEKTPEQIEAEKAGIMAEAARAAEAKAEATAAVVVDRQGQAGSCAGKVRGAVV